jgi:sporulation protein YlmC with PRC-barrel domain
MNRLVLTSVAAAVMSLGTSAALAQTATQPPASGGSTGSTPPAATAPATRTDPMPNSTGMTGTTAASTGKSSDYTGMRDAKSWERTHRVSKIIGTDVVNSKGEKIGDVEDIVLDAKGNVAYAVVSTGGFLGVGDKMHAVPWTAIRTNTGTDNFMLDVDKDRLRSAPGFDQSSWPNVNDPKWSSENRRYFPASGTTRKSTTSPTPTVVNK